jgi:hypothetical protein
VSTSDVGTRAEPVLAPAAAGAASGRLARVEYLGFQNVAEDRVFRLRVLGPDGSIEHRLSIPIAAFASGRARLQDGPDVCYQRLLRAVAAGDPASCDVIAIEDAELASYREAHTPVRKRRAWNPASRPPPANPPPKHARVVSAELPAAALVTNDTPAGLEEGQRVSHAVFGVGVTTSTGGGHTVVRFDQDGPKTFVTSMLELDVLSGPHTWESGPRGNNRPCRTAPPVGDGGGPK